jgi:hypothetical protein
MDLMYNEYFHTNISTNRFEPLSDNEDDDEEDETYKDIQLQLPPQPPTNVTTTVLQNIAEEEKEEDMPELVIDENLIDMGHNQPTIETPPTEINDNNKPTTSKLSREMRRLDGFFNPEATQSYKSLRSRTTRTEVEQEQEPTSGIILDDLEELQPIVNPEINSLETSMNEDQESNTSTSSENEEELKTYDKALAMVSTSPNTISKICLNLKKDQTHLGCQ